MHPESEPTSEQLRAMAYADGELSKDERQSFEQQMSLAPALAGEVAEYRALQVLARQMAPPEPMDYEWRRIEADPTHRGLQLFGWIFFIVGSLGTGALGLWGLANGDGPLLPRALGGSAIVGFLVLLLGTARNRMRTMHLDPYRNIQR